MSPSTKKKVTHRPKHQTVHHHHQQQQQHVATYYSISVNAFPYEALQYLQSSVLCFQSVKDVDFDHVVLQLPQLSFFLAGCTFAFIMLLCCKMYQYMGT